VIYFHIKTSIPMLLTHGWTIFILVMQLSLTWKCPVLRSYFASPLRSQCKAAVWIKSALYCSNRGSSLRRSWDSPYRVGARNNLQPKIKILDILKKGAVRLGSDKHKDWKKKHIPIPIYHVSRMNNSHGT
jgi:hypothetical protein